MPFSIELLKRPDGVSIKVQAVKNTINVYFTGSDAAASKVRGDWIHLEAHFITEMTGYIDEPVRGPDASHIKKDHTNPRETEILHTHSEFTSEITPHIFSSYLTKLFAQQQQGEHSGEKYQFFLNRGEVDELTKKFQIYYMDYKNSSTGKLYEKETRLTKEEQLAYDEAVEEEQASRKASKEMELFVNSLMTSILTGRHPLHRMPGPSVVLPSEEPDERADCVLM